MEILKNSQEITIHGIEYCVSCRGGGIAYYLTNQIGGNDLIFEKLGIKDKYNFVYSLVRNPNPVYEGVFPEVGSLKDLTKVVEALINYNMDKFQFTLEDYKKYIDLACPSWKRTIVSKHSEELLMDGKACLDKKMLHDMVLDADEKQLTVLKSLFPHFFTQTNIVSNGELRIGEALLTKDNELIVRTYDRFVDFNDCGNTYDEDAIIYGTKVKYKITIEK